MRSAVVLALTLLVVGAVAKTLPIRQGEGYIIWCEGNCNVNTTGRGSGGLMLMGGGTDVDAAFRWFNGKTNGGDVVVLRASGTDAYNEYIYDLGSVNSVWTILTTSRVGAQSKDVEEVIYQAEGIFLAGGDQSQYVSYWVDTPLQRAVQNAIDVKKAVLGGTSAGLAVLGEFIYTGEKGSIISEEALVNPYDPWMTLTGPLFNLPIMTSIITDSHFRDRDRMGRLITMMARLEKDGDVRIARGIAVSEQSALLVDATGSATFSGRGEAYFLEGSGSPSRCEPNTPLTYSDVLIYKLDSTTATFNLNTWTGRQGVSYTIDVISGKLSSSQGVGRNY